MRRFGFPAALLCVAIGWVSGTSAQPAAPTGRTVWDGVYTAEQAQRGHTLFLQNCAECHGANLQGGAGKALAGEVFWTDWREQTVDALLAYVSKNMPFSEDGSLAGTLSPSTYVDIVAHMLSANELPAGKQDLTANSSVGVKIIRKDGPGELPSTTLARVVGCLAPRGADGSWQLTKASRPERSTAALPPAGQVGPGDRSYQLKFVLTNLTKFVGHKMAVTGLLLGDGGKDGINVNTATSVADKCE
jgi:S-disulfanyl-L-cysteine oxidoreductase SoxD